MKQLYKLSSNKEREEVTIVILQAIQKRKQRLIFSRGRLVLEKRGNFSGAHFLNDRRRNPLRIISLASFGFILTTVSVATWLLALYANPKMAAAAICIHLLMLSTVLIVKPYNFGRQHA